MSKDKAENIISILTYQLNIAGYSGQVEDFEQNPLCVLWPDVPDYLK